MTTPKPLELKGRRILVTGASSGIGQATAQWLSKLQADLVVCGRNEERIQQTLTSLEPGSHSAATCDFDNTARVHDWLKQLASDVGPFDGLVHAAGVEEWMPLRYMRADAIESMLNVNYVSGVMLAAAFRKTGICRKPASLVFVSSVSALVGQAGLSTYSASKAAIVAFVRSAASELASEQIRVNCVVPGLVKTPMGDAIERRLLPEQVEQLRAKHLLGFGEPLDVAYSIGFLLSDAARWITGTALTVDGGFTAQR